MSIPSDFQSRQRTTDLSANLIMQAPAGSGKTSELTKRFLACLAVSNNPEEVVGITFTNKATAEMQDRILEALINGQSEEAPEAEHEKQLWSLARQVLARDTANGWRLLENASRLRIMTFDKLSAYLATQLPVLSGMGGGMSVEENAPILYREAILALFDEFEQTHLDRPTQDALEYLLRFAGNRLDRLLPLLSDLLGKRDQWLEVITSDDLGMEEALRGLIHGTLHQARRAIPSDVQCELVELVHGNSHNEPLAWAASLGAWPSADIDTLPMWRELAELLLTKDGTLIKRITVKHGFPAKEANTERMKALLESLHEGEGSSVAGAMEQVRRLPDPGYPQEMEAFRKALGVALVRLVAHLKVVFTNRGKIDFIEVAQRALEALGDEVNVSDVLQRMDHVIRHILVDEVQDTSLTQIRLLQRLTSGWQPDEGRTLFFVGDPMQSIYMFRQAEVRLFMQMWQEKALSPHIALEPVRLSNNFRSRAPVVSWFNTAFRQIFPPSANPYTSAVPFEPSDTLDASTEGGVQVHPQIGADDVAEAATVVSLVHEAMTSEPDGSIAVLVRSRSHVVEIVRALKHAGLSFSAKDIDPISATSPVGDLIHLIQALRQPLDRTAWFHVLRSPYVGIAWEDLPAISMATGKGSVLGGIGRLLAEQPDSISADSAARLGKLQRTLREVADTPTLREDLAKAAEAVWYRLGGDLCISEAHRQDVRATLALLRDYCHAGQLKNIEGFRLAVENLYATPESGTVEIMTIHASKGLEFDTVILPGLGKMSRRDDPPMFHLQNLPEGFVVAPAVMREMRMEMTPGKRLYDAMANIKAMAAENERVRLLYVAATRARKHLHLLGHASTGKDAPYPVAGSMLAILWPAVSEHYLNAAQAPQAAPVADAVIDTYRTPILKRLPSGMEGEAVAPICAPLHDRHIRPSELLLREPEYSVELENRAIIGRLYHELMEKMATQGLAPWPLSRLMQMQEKIALRAERMGMAASETDAAAARVVQLLENTLGCAEGKWLIAPGCTAHSEWPLAGYLDGAWVSARIDRAILDGDTLWLVDYKTTQLNANNAVDIADKYRPQMTMYESLAKAIHPSKTIRKAIFLAEQSQLIEL